MHIMPYMHVATIHKHEIHATVLTNKMVQLNLYTIYIIIVLWYKKYVRCIGIVMVIR